MTRKTHCCQEGHGTRGLFWGNWGREQHHPPPPTHQQERVKARWHPVALLKDRCGDEFLTHVGICAQNHLSCLGLTGFTLSVRVWLDRLAEMQMIISCSFSFLFVWFHKKPKDGQAGSCLSIQGSETGCLVHFSLAWRTCDWQIVKTEMAQYMQTNKQGQGPHIWNLEGPDWLSTNYKSYSKCQHLHRGVHI